MLQGSPHHPKQEGKGTLIAVVPQSIQCIHSHIWSVSSTMVKKVFAVVAGEWLYEDKVLERVLAPSWQKETSTHTHPCLWSQLNKFLSVFPMPSAEECDEQGKFCPQRNLHMNWERSLQPNVSDRGRSTEEPRKQVHTPVCG